MTQVTHCIGCVRTPPPRHTEAAVGVFPQGPPVERPQPPPRWSIGVCSAPRWLPTTPTVGSVVVEEWVTGLLLACTLCMAPKGTCSRRACVLQGFISGRSLSKGDGDSALGEMAPRSRRNTLHDLIGFCLSDALCLEVKIPVFHHSCVLEGECKRTPEGVLEKNSHGVHTGANRTTYVGSWKNDKVILSIPSF